MISFEENKPLIISNTLEGYNSRRDTLRRVPKLWGSPRKP